MLIGCPVRRGRSTVATAGVGAGVVARGGWPGAGATAGAAAAAPARRLRSSMRAGRSPAAFALRAPAPRERLALLVALAVVGLAALSARPARMRPRVFRRVGARSSPEDGARAFRFG